MTPTVADLLVESLRARTVVPDGQSAPVAILWPDPKEEWRGLLPILRDATPELLVLGDYDPSAGVGPAIWLRCVVDGTLEGPRSAAAGPAANSDLGSVPSPRAGTVSAPNPVPILYLPRVGREDLRAGPYCPDHVKPLVELMYRGVLWHNPKGRPWTPAAFLRSDPAWGLQIARDPETQQALTSALPEVAMLPVAQLQGRRRDADDFNRLLAGDLEGDVLRWMADAEGARVRLGDGRWSAFCNRCRSELHLDPESDADVVAGVKLAGRTGGWASVWDRFAEAASIHPGVVDVLRRSRPSGEIALERDCWPDLNDEAEAEARKALAALPGLSPKEARRAVAKLEQHHGERRQWLWASLGQSPVSPGPGALGPLGGFRLRSGRRDHAFGSRRALRGQRLASRRRGQGSVGKRCAHGRSNRRSSRPPVAGALGGGQRPRLPIVA